MAFISSLCFQVDVVEGVCPQTRICLKQAFIENLKPILVLNKIDRLILEKQLTPLDAYVHIMQLLEQVNATMGNIFASDIVLKEVKTSNVSARKFDQKSIQNYKQLSYFVVSPASCHRTIRYQHWRIVMIRQFTSHQKVEM